LTFGARLKARACTTSGPKGSAEQIAKHVFKFGLAGSSLPPTCTCPSEGATGIERVATAKRPASAGITAKARKLWIAVRVNLASVILRFAVWVVEKCEGRRNAFKALFSCLIVWVRIGMQFFGELAIDFSNLGKWGSARNAKHCIRFFCHALISQIPV
jgi:hypothetical protein